MNGLRRSLVAFLVALILGVPINAHAAGGRYLIDGGTRLERTQVRRALDVSSFDWSRVPATIAVHVRRGEVSHASRGEVWLDADLLDSGTFAWGTVLDEFSHQIDFFLLTPEDRATLETALGARAWCYEDSRFSTHAEQGCERFSSMVPWAYWQSKDNAYRPLSRHDESASMPPEKFRALLERLLAA